MAWVLNNNTIHVRKYEYIPGGITLNEKPIIPKGTNYNGAPTTLLQGLGKKRDRIKLEAVDTVNIISSLISSMNNYSNIGLVIDNGSIQTCYIAPGSLNYDWILGSRPAKYTWSCELIMTGNV